MNKNELLASIHKKLNFIYKKAKETEELLKSELNIPCKLQYCDNNYLRINQEYELQEYPIPIIVIKDGLDIGFNLDNVFIEKFIHKDNLRNININRIERTFERLEVYGGKDCLKDFYEYGDHSIDVSKKIELANEQNVGIAIYMTYENFEKVSIMENMHLIKELLNIEIV